MMSVIALTWTFRALFVVGALVSGFAAFRYNRRSGGGWRVRSAGRMLMMLVVGLCVAFSSVALRVLMLLVKPHVPSIVLHYVPWLDTVVLVVTCMAVIAVIIGLFQFMIMVEREQPNYSSAEKRTRT